MDIRRLTGATTPLDNTEDECCPEHLERLLFGAPGNPLNPCDRSTIRPYMQFRLDHFYPSLLSTWTPGDILLLGDSLTDIARVYDCNPVMPRTHNLGILGARISDQVYIIDQVESTFRSLNKPFYPSQIAVRIGTNDLLINPDGTFNAFSESVREQYCILLSRLRKFRRDNGNCRITVCSIPPGIPLPANPDCPNEYTPEPEKYLLAVSQANEWLIEESRKIRFRFSLINNTSMFWDSETESLRTRFYRMNWDDTMHWNCKGYFVVNTLFQRHFYQHLKSPKGFIGLLSPHPCGKPASPLSLPDIHFRYVFTRLQPNEEICIRTRGSQKNYVGIFGPPTHESGYPVVEEYQSSGQVAEVKYTNCTDHRESLILCFGSQSLWLGRYTVDKGLSKER